MDAPRAPLAARFGRALLRRLDQALGCEEEAIDPRRPLPALIAERRFAEPIALMEDIAATLASLAGALAKTLEERGEGARAFELALFRVDGAVSRTEVGTSRPLRAPKLVRELFREKFAGLAEEIDAGFGFDMVRLPLPPIRARSTWPETRSAKPISISSSTASAPASARTGSAGLSRRTVISRRGQIR